MISTTSYYTYHTISTLVKSSIDYLLGYHYLWLFFNDNFYSKATHTNNADDERIQWVYNVSHNTLTKTKLKDDELFSHRVSWLSVNLVDGGKTYSMDEWLDTFRCFTNDLSCRDVSIESPNHSLEHSDENNDRIQGQYFPSQKLLMACWYIYSGNWIPGNPVLNIIDNDGNEESYDVSNAEKWNNDITDILFNLETSNHSESTSEKSSVTADDDDEDALETDENLDTFTDLADISESNKTNNMSSISEPIHNLRSNIQKRGRQNSIAE